MNIDRLKKASRHDPDAALRLVREYERRGLDLVAEEMRRRSGVLRYGSGVEHVQGHAVPALEAMQRPDARTASADWVVMVGLHDALARLDPARLLPWYTWRVKRATEAGYPPRMGGAGGQQMPRHAQRPVACHVLCNDIQRIIVTNWPALEDRRYSGEMPWINLRGRAYRTWRGPNENPRAARALLAGELPECICIGAGVERGRCPHTDAPSGHVCGARLPPTGDCHVCGATGLCPRCGVADVECLHCVQYAEIDEPLPCHVCHGTGRVPGKSPVIEGVF